MNINEDNYNLNILNYLKENIIQIFLLIFVFVIIYLIDSLTRYNISKYGLPGLQPNPTKQIFNKERKNKK